MKDICLDINIIINISEYINSVAIKYSNVILKIILLLELRKLNFFFQFFIKL